MFVLVVLVERWVMDFASLSDAGYGFAFQYEIGESLAFPHNGPSVQGTPRKGTNVSVIKQRI